MSWQIESLNSNIPVLSGHKKVDLTAGINRVSINVDVNGKLKKWNEFTPEVYVLKMSVKAGQYSDKSESEFGFYQVSHNGTKILINGNPGIFEG